MVGYTLEQRWEILRQIYLQMMPNFDKKKNHLFRWSSFWSGLICKQAKLSHLSHRKPDAPKTCHCLVRILVQRHNWASFLWKWTRRGRYSQWRSLAGHVEQIFFSQKLKRRHIATERLTDDADFGKINHIFIWSSLWSWWVSKQAKLPHLGNRKPALIHWKVNAPKTIHYLVGIFFQRYNWAIFLRKWARRGRYSQSLSLAGHVKRIIFHKNWREGHC